MADTEKLMVLVNILVEDAKSAGYHSALRSSSDETIEYWEDRAERSRADVIAASHRVESIGPDYVPGELDRTAPPRIFLQIDIEGGIEDRDYPWTDSMDEDVSWCAESIGGTEIQYVRADIAASQRSEVVVSDAMMSAYLLAYRSGSTVSLSPECERIRRGLTAALAARGD